VTQSRKLIEVSLPLEAINRESAREKSIRHGHPSTLHLWWSRKPTAAARAVLFAQLVDDPSSHPDQFPTDEAQKIERDRLHDIIRRLVVWADAGDEHLLREAHEEILKSTNGNPPAILDPFAGGGTIPLEAQRLGLEAHASDLNPVAVLITKALVDIPSKFAGHPPVFPGAAESRMGTWPRATGLAEDVRRYGAWMCERVLDRIGHLYPMATLPDGSKAPVIAWIWARTVTCPNPGCGIEMPLSSKWWLNRNRGKEAYIVPEVVADADAASRRSVAYTVGHGTAGAPGKDDGGTVGRSGATCVACRATVDLKYVRAEGCANRMGTQLMAVVAETNRQRVYLPPTPEHSAVAAVPRPEDVPTGKLSTHPQYMGTPRYGMTQWADLFTSRQLTALTTFSDLVAEARKQAIEDAQAAGLPDGPGLAEGGITGPAYADAIATFLALCASKMAVFHCSLARWRPDATKTAPAFGRQAISMAWDFAECQPFAGAGGDWQGVVSGAASALDRLVPLAKGHTSQADAATRDYSGYLISTDPPYYDNVPYGDLSDFFYIWLRRSLRDVYPDLFSTMLVPKAGELVANTQRHGGIEGASAFFQAGFEHVFARARASAREAFPIVTIQVLGVSFVTGGAAGSTFGTCLLRR